MGINGVNQRSESNKSLYAQETQHATGAKRSLVFTDAAQINQAISTGKVEVDGVSVELSEEVMQVLKDAREKWSRERAAEAQRYMMEYSSYAAKRQSEMSEDINADMAKALETARRIARGDIVPAKDERKLMEYDHDLYQMAKNAAMLHWMEKHKKHKSLYKDDEDREYTDPEKETTPMREIGIEVEVSLGDMPTVESEV